MQSDLLDFDDLLPLMEALEDTSDDGEPVTNLTAKPGLFSALLVANRGRILFKEDFGSEVKAELFQFFTDLLSEKLQTEPECDFRFSFDGTQYAAVGACLGNPNESILLGALSKPGESVRETGIRPISTTLLLMFAEVALGRTSRENELRTRVEHLTAEHEMLKASQSEAVASAIEERDKRLQQQRADLEQMEAMMEFAADGMMTITQTGVIESFNNAASRIFGYERAEVIGRDASFLAPGPNRKQHGPGLTELIRDGSSRKSAQRLRETLGKRKDGRIFPLEIGISEIPIDSGYILSAIFRDIEDRKKSESQLVQAQKMESIGQLAAGIAHEINTPTQFVGDNTRFLEDVFRDLTPLLSLCRRLCEIEAEEGTVPASVAKIVADIVALADEADLDYLVDEIPRAIDQSLEGIDRVARIVRSMKEFSHPSGEAQQAVDINRALESTATVCRNEWKYVADLQTDLDPDLPLITCIPGECNQVFLNLIINAAHAIGDTLAGRAEDKGLIKITSRHSGDWVEIRISDDGSGIPESFHSQIFDPFFTTKEVGRGTGQGLAIAHSVITEKHGGTIRFETNVGTGTTFIIRLPVSGRPIRG